MSIPASFFSWEVLATLAGASSAVFLVVSLTKDLIPPVIPVRIYAWILAWAILSTAALASGNLTAPVLVINLLNGGIVALAAMGEYEVAKAYGLIRTQRTDRVV
ncbi:MAG: hypothetical protein Q8P31_05165 [Bacillota bacterium]|nr:hypothetical protein [Bacillota bacterium]